MRCDYPFFVPPRAVLGKNHHDWNKKEADTYLNWLQNTIDDRVEYLLAYLDVDARNINNSECCLSEVGQKIKKIITESPFCEDSQLTNCGYAICADVGLLIAVLMLRTNPEIHWEVLRAPRKATSRNLPVLKGRGTMFLDPVYASIAEAKSLLRGHKDGSIWMKIYEHWLEVL